MWELSTEFEGNFKRFIHSERKKREKGMERKVIEQKGRRKKRRGGRMVGWPSESRLYC